MKSHVAHNIHEESAVLRVFAFYKVLDTLNGHESIIDCYANQRTYKQAIKYNNRNSCTFSVQEYAPIITNEDIGRSIRPLTVNSADVGLMVNVYEGKDGNDIVDHIMFLMNKFNLKKFFWIGHKFIGRHWGTFGLSAWMRSNDDKICFYSDGIADMYAAHNPRS